MPLLLQFQKQRVNRAVLNSERLAADLLDTACDAVGMERAHTLQRLEDHQRQRPLANFLPLSHLRSYWLPIEIMTQLVLEANSNRLVTRLPGALPHFLADLNVLLYASSADRGCRHRIVGVLSNPQEGARLCVQSIIRAF